MTKRGAGLNLAVKASFPTLKVGKEAFTDRHARLGNSSPAQYSKGREGVERWGSQKKKQKNIQKVFG
ncbi:hypothetical protein ACFWMR_41535, partial [Amycolatopsis thailandensis]|uniref:hypothetical protein n=1 Tax=Amycolatopsis thailandensis TaxID=589330 RepID=UPI0036553F43